VVFGILSALVVLAAFVALAVAGLRTWRAARTLGRDVATASERIDTASAALDTAMNDERLQRLQDHRSA
jgi:hypothetical protein